MTRVIGAIVTAADILERRVPLHGVHLGDALRNAPHGLGLLRGAVHILLGDLVVAVQAVLEHRRVLLLVVVVRAGAGLADGPGAAVHVAALARPGLGLPADERRGPGARVAVPAVAGDGRAAALLHEEAHQATAAGRAAGAARRQRTAVVLHVVQLDAHGLDRGYGRAAGAALARQAAPQLLLARQVRQALALHRRRIRVVVRHPRRRVVRRWIFFSACDTNYHHTNSTKFAFPLFLPYVVRKIFHEKSSWTAGNKLHIIFLVMTARFRAFAL